MAQTRSRQSVALGLSLALWPGAGQLYLRRTALGLLLALGSLALLVLLAWDVVATVARLVPEDPGEALSNLGSLVGDVRRGLPARAVVAQVLILAAWLAGIADAAWRPPTGSTER